MAEPRSEPTTEKRRQQTEEARRSARYKHARERIKRMVDAAPPFSDEQLTKLAVLLQGGGDEG